MSANDVARNGTHRIRNTRNSESRDAYRDVHEASKSLPASHYTGRGDRRTSHRYDYIFASNQLRTNACEYIAKWIERDADGRRLSDHAAVAADLSLAD
jgi:endonuclease/exonuclease/phosphatase family metal-dependent hydrolase